jgi:hypothetical protein
VLGPVTACGRDAIAVAATPRRDVLRSVPGHRSHDRISHDRIEVAVDAELGILLRRIETSGGVLVTLTELTDVTLNPPEAADPARFAPRPGSHRGEAALAGTHSAVKAGTRVLVRRPVATTTINQ